MKYPYLLFLLFLAWAAQAADTVLIFTKTAGFREDNIAQARLALKQFLETKGLVVDTSENAGLFTDASLAKYKTVIFLKTSGDILDSSQQAAFEKFFRAGGGFVGIHAALDTEYNWAFYGIIIGGAYFNGLAGDLNTKQNILIEDTANIATKNLPRPWPRTDEVYNFKANPRDSKAVTVHVLVTVDESTYSGGTPGKDHPMSWYDTYQGGRAWITAMGHTTASYQDPLFLGHLWGGVQYALGRTATTAAFPGFAPRRVPTSGKFLRLGSDPSDNLGRFYQPSGRLTNPDAKADGIELFINR